MKLNSTNRKGVSSAKTNSNDKIETNKSNPINSKDNASKLVRDIKPKNETNEDLIKDEKYGEDHIISKLQKKGYESLTLEEMAVTLISPTFEAEYNLKTGGDWNSNFKSKTVERLNRAKFDINWMNKKTNTAFALFFDLVAKGDIQRCLEFIRKNASYTDELLSCVDQNQKSPTHIAAKNGHYNLMTTLIEKGFSIFVRDKFLRAPLHLAAQFGHATVADLLIKSKSDIYSKDSCGRNVLHYACCSNSIELITLLVGQEPELVFTTDNYLRSPLHYVVWNTNPNQLEIAKKLLDAKDALDEEGRSPLHYASEAGRGKIAALLVKFGANVSIRDGRLHKTPIELAPSENIREIIIVYSGIPYKPKKEDIQFLNKGPEIGKIDHKETMLEDDKLRRGRQKSQPKRVKALSTVVEEREEKERNNNDINNFNDFILRNQKEKLLDFMKNIQEYGIKSMQHLTNPSIYSGSWIENINNLEDFYKFLSKTDPSQAALCIFNLLNPYEGSLPSGKGEEKQMSMFFTKNTKEKEDIKTLKNFNENNGFPENIMAEIEKQNLILTQQRNEISFLMTELKTFQIQKNQKVDNIQEFDQIKNELTRYKAENEMLRKINDDLQSENKNLKGIVDNYKERVDTGKVVIST